jgi:uncharacterized protein YndB with AHSA1/START domain
MTEKVQTEVIAEKDRQDLFIIRDFNAPIEKVFRAFSEAAILERYVSTQTSCNGGTMSNATNPVA